MKTVEKYDYINTHNAVWSDSNNEWIHYEIDNPPFRATSLGWLLVGTYEFFVLPLLRFPAKIEAAVTSTLNKLDAKSLKKN